jgi:heat shock protein HtpX
MLRIALFLMTNLAIVVVLGVVMSLFGVGQYLDASGGIDLVQLLIFSAIVGFTGSLISLFLSKTMAKHSMGVQLITQPRSADEQWLVSTVQQLAQEAGIKTPEIGIFPAREANAFATGWNRNDALVAVSLGLLQRFERDEVRAVLAHEIGHVANGDMVTLSLIQGVVNTFVIFFARIIGHVVDKAVFKTERGNGPGFLITSIVAQLVLGILASIIVMAFSRYREYRADAAGAHLAGRSAMIRALQRLQAEVNAGVQSPMPENLKAFGISSGFKQQLGALFASHPPLQARIEALSRQA